MELRSSESRSVGLDKMCERRWWVGDWGVQYSGVKSKETSLTGLVSVVVMTLWSKVNVTAGEIILAGKAKNYMAKSF